MLKQIKTIFSSINVLILALYLQLIVAEILSNKISFT
jgi:hypothetical protein